MDETSEQLGMQFWSSGEMSKLEKEDGHHQSLVYFKMRYLIMLVQSKKNKNRSLNSKKYQQLRCKYCLVTGREIVFREMREFITLNAEDQKSFKEGECQLGPLLQIGLCQKETMEFGD